MLLVVVLLCLLGSSWAVKLPWDLQKHPEVKKNASSPFSLDWDNTVAICAIMRQEHVEDVREWVQYHRYIGVDHVLMYDNNEDGGAQAAELADFIQDGFLTYFTVPGQAMQIPVYHHCLSHSAEAYTWLAAIDIDEFLVVEDERVRLREPKEQLKEVLREFRFYPALFLQWKGFGPGSHRERPEPGGPLEHYQHCMPLDWPPANMRRLEERGLPEDADQAVKIVQYGKTIANRFWTSHASTAHGFMYWGEAMPVTDAKQRVSPALSYDQSRVDHAQIRFIKGIGERNKRLVVHHYATRSFEDYQTKLERGAGDKKRGVHLRGMGFFQALNESTYEHPSCESAVSYANKCCRDEEGNPWPPIPKVVSKSSYKVHQLSKTEVPTLDMMKVNRGQSYRKSHYPPFPSRKWRSSAVICARWDRSTDEGALREWLDHHRHIGVNRVLLYADDKEPKPQTEALQQYPGDFLVWESLRKRGAHEDESQFIRQQCIKENQKDYAYITFLHTYDYIMPRGPGRHRQGRLINQLKTFEYRFGPGVVLPVYEFGKFDMGPEQESQQVYPLRHFKDCTYLGHHLMTRTIANTYYVEAPIGEMDYKFVYGMLPVTDGRMPWVPQLLDIPTEDERRIFPNSTALDEDMLQSQMQRFHLSQPFGESLAVFSFPPESAVPLPGEEWRHRLRTFISELHSADSSCGEALQAADVCCKWELEAQQ